MKSLAFLLSTLAFLGQETALSSHWQNSWLQYGTNVQEIELGEGFSTYTISGAPKGPKLVLETKQSKRIIALIPVTGVVDKETAKYLHASSDSLRWHLGLFYRMIKGDIPFKVYHPYYGKIVRVNEVPKPFADSVLRAFDGTAFQGILKRLIDSRTNLDTEFPNITAEHRSYANYPILERLLENMSLEDLDNLKTQGFDELPKEVEEKLIGLLVSVQGDELRGGKEANTELVTTLIGNDNATLVLARIPPSKVGVRPDQVESF